MWLKSLFVIFLNPQHLEESSPCHSVSVPFIPDASSSATLPHPSLYPPAAGPPYCGRLTALVLLACLPHGLRQIFTQITLFIPISSTLSHLQPNPWNAGTQLPFQSSKPSFFLTQGKFRFTINFRVGEKTLCFLNLVFSYVFLILGSLKLIKVFTLLLDNTETWEYLNYNHLLHTRYVWLVFSIWILFFVCPESLLFY